MGDLLGSFIAGFVFYLVPAWIVWRKDKEVRNALLILPVIINAIYVFISHEQYISLIYFGLWVILGAIAIRTPDTNKNE